ncbi:MAG: hypothetical protein AABX54_01990 [Nanoarchaeota archaeon]
MVSPQYLNANEFLKRAGEAVTIGRDVMEEVKREYGVPIPFSETQAGEQASQVSGLLDKVL